MLLLTSCGGGGSDQTTGTAAGTSPGSGTTSTGTTPGDGGTVTASLPAGFATVPSGNAIVNGVTYYKASLLQPAYGLSEDASGAIQRFELRSGDRGAKDDEATGKERYELVTKHSGGIQQQYVYAQATDVWIAFSFMVEPGAAILSRYAIVGQMHPNPNADFPSISPPLYFNLAATDTDSVIYSLNTRTAADAADVAGAKTITRWSTSLARGRWANVVMRVRFDAGGAGQLQLWVDGVEQVDLNQFGLGYLPPVDQLYWQYGLYRTENANPLAVRYANVEQGTNSLLVRVNSPLPIPSGAM